MSEHDRIKAQLDHLEELVDQHFLALTGRVSRGFRSRSRTGVPGVSEEERALRRRRLEQELEEATRVYLGEERNAMRDAISQSLPAEWKRTLNRLRWNLNLLLVVVIIGVVVLVGLTFKHQRELVKQAPSAYQIELMIKGWEAQQKEQVGGHHGDD